MRHGELVRQALTNYDIPSPKVRLLRDLLDLTFRVQGESTVYALRISNPQFQDRQAFASQAEWQDYVGQTLTVPEIIRTRDGELICSLRESRAGCLSTWIEGRKQKRVSPKSARALGELSAHLHRLAEAFEVPGGFKRKLWDENKMVGRFDIGRPDPLDGHLTPEGSRKARQVGEALRDLLQTRRDSRTNFGLITADLGPNNLAWLEGRPHLFDFNDTGWGLYAYDLSLTCGGLGPTSLEREPDVLAGYQTVRHLPEDFTSRREVFRAAHLLRSMRWEAGKNSPNREVLSRRIDRFSRLAID